MERLASSFCISRASFRRDFGTRAEGRRPNSTLERLHGLKGLDSQWSPSSVYTRASHTASTANSVPSKFSLGFRTSGFRFGV